MKEKREMKEKAGWDQGCREDGVAPLGADLTPLV